MISDLSNINIDDKKLVKQCQHGDSAAMERLIVKYQDRIYNIIFKICANKDDAAELCQDTFVKVIENIHGFKGRSAFYTWIFRIAVNLTLNYCKRRAKAGFESLEREIGSAHSESASQLKSFLTDENSPDPVVVAQNHELCEIVMRLLMRLDYDQRSVLILRDIEDMSYAEIADVLEIELGTVKSRLSRARNNLMELLEAVYDG